MRENRKMVRATAPLLPFASLVAVSVCVVGVLSFVEHDVVSWRARRAGAGGAG